MFSVCPHLYRFPKQLLLWFAFMTTTVAHHQFQHFYVNRRYVCTYVAKRLHFEGKTVASKTGLYTYVCTYV